MIIQFYWLKLGVANLTPDLIKANLTPDFCYELNSSFFLGKKRWDELNSRQNS